MHVELAVGGGVGRPDAAPLPSRARRRTAAAGAAAVRALNPDPIDGELAGALPDELLELV
ncbi:MULTISPECIES: hypothetical protein [Kitasatospora]|uniref:FXSXX-COOH protein n=1 Tax=Kitasatospora cystarginea TaxID=58350 RepID=A0ABN3E456_9ACTN